MTDTAAPSEIKKLSEDLASTFEHMKGALDTQDAEIKKYGAATAETVATLDRINSRMDDIEVKLSRPGATEARVIETEEKRAAFAEYIRKGDSAGPDVLKTLSRGNDTAGGVFVPELLATELIANIVEVSPIRQLASVVTLTEGDAYPYNRRTGESAATWAGEQETRTASTEPAYGRGRIPLHEMTLMVDISRQLIDMSGFDIEGEWMNESVEQSAKLEGAAFVSGNAVNKPQGFTDASAGLSYTPGTSASVIAADGLINITHDVKAGYLNNAHFVMNRATLKAIRTLKDGQGNYLWTAGYGVGLKDGVPATIAGYPYVIAQDMPDIASNAFPVAFGDFGQGYKVVDSAKVTQIRDEATQAANGNVRFWVARYVGGQVVKTEALRLLKISTS